MAPLFLDIGQVLCIHLSLIEHYGGHGGVRDIGLLQSAIAMPQSGFGGERLHRDLFEMAAAYLYHIVRNHPFVDGNAYTEGDGTYVPSPSVYALPSTNG